MGRMAPFEVDVVTRDPLDFRLLQDGPITLYWRAALLHEAISQLKELGYDVVELDATDWLSNQEMHSDISRALDFPGYYGRTLNALSDCLSDVVTYDFGSRREATGLVLAVSHFDCFAVRDGGAAEALVDILAHQARFGMLFGHRMMVLLQTDDPAFETGPIGAAPAGWNRQERLLTDRR